jgi:hypothetical protein
MPRIRLLPLCLTILGLQLARWQCAAGEMLHLTEKTIPLPEQIVCLQACELHTDEGDFLFTPPPTWSQQFKAQENEISYRSPSNDAFIKFSITWTKPGELTPPKSEFLRDYLKTKYADAKILEEFPCYTCSQSGIAFQLEQTSVNLKTALTRVAFVPFPGGLLEFRLTTAADLFRQRQLSFSAMVSSLRYTAATNSATHSAPKKIDSK